MVAVVAFDSLWLALVKGLMDDGFLMENEKLIFYDTEHWNFINIKFTWDSPLLTEEIDLHRCLYI